MKIFLFTLIATVTLLVGCSPPVIPVATAAPRVTQDKLHAAQHWDILAHDVAQRLRKTIEKTFPNAEIVPSLFVKSDETQADNPFGIAFFQLLTSRLIEQKLVILDSTCLEASECGNENDPETLILKYNMQVIHHKDRQLKYQPPGFFTLLSGGIWIVERAIEHISHPILATIPLALMADSKGISDYMLPKSTNTEVIITTSVLRNKQYIFGYSRIYYINGGDADHYQSKTSKLYKVESQQ